MDVPTAAAAGASRDRVAVPLRLHDGGAAPAPKAFPASAVGRRAGGRTLAQGGTDAEVPADDELRAVVMPAGRADYRLIDTYRPDAGVEPLGTPVVAYHGRQGPAVGEAAVREWRRYARGTAEARSFPGGHFPLREARRTLTAGLRERLLTFVRLTRPADAARGRAACTANAPR
ncbi:thioesterase II family protein [Streptomyces sp. NPDC102259]|uniref:thioesterase II family protein n=1 Tax=Streptomyces sp. NPDC102259 TaxID=3366148 RepID=UPI0037F1AB4C